VKSIISLFLICTTSAVFATTQLVTLKTNDALQLREYLEQQGFDIAGHNRKTGEISVVTEFPFLLEWERQQGAWNQDLSFEISAVQVTEPFSTYAAREFNDAEKEYFGPDQVRSELESLAAQNPSVAKLYDLTQMLGVSKTTEGQSIYGLHVSSSPATIENKPKILMIAQHHAREIMTQHAVLDAAKDLLARLASGDGEAKRAVQNLSIWFVPVLNPDGLKYVFSGNRMWRKNRAHNPGGSRGVDLNRNYSVKWGACGQHSSIESSETYKGKSPDSEAEVILAEKLNEKLHFQFAISYHSSGDEVLYPYLCGHMAEAKVYYELRDRIKSVTGFGHRLPSSGGEDHEFHYNKLGTLAYLLEIGDEFQPSYSTYENKVWPTIKGVLPLMMTEAQSNHVEIRTIDADSGRPVQVQVALQELGFKEGETRSTDSFGVHRWRLPQGSYKMTIEAPGFESKVLSFTATGGIDKLEVKLNRNWGPVSFQDISNWLFSWKS
jgi:hypothetical protein